MKKLTDTQIDIEYEELEKYLPLFPKDKRFELIVRLRNVKYEFLITLKSNQEKMLCLGPAAINKKLLETHSKKPIYNRQSWKFKESTIYYNDPTRYLGDGLLVGWGIGTQDDYYLENIKEIILKIIDYNKIKHENLLFYGSSAGGFTSIQLATMIKDSSAIADIPQTNVRSWVFYNDLKEISFPELSKEELIEKFEYRHSVIAMMEKKNYVPNLTIIFSVTHYDMERQNIPFIRQVKKLNYEFNTEKGSKIKIIMNPISAHDNISTLKLNHVIENHWLIKNKQNLKNHVYDLKKETIKNKKIKEQNIELKQENKKIKKQNNLLQKQISEHTFKLEEIKRSHSWKITSPLRMLVYKLKNIFK